MKSGHGRAYKTAQHVTQADGKKRRCLVRRSRRAGGVPRTGRAASPRYLAIKATERKLIAKRPWIFVIILLCVALLVEITELSGAQRNRQLSPTKEYTNGQFGLIFLIPNGMDLYTIENPEPMASLISSKSPFIFVNPSFTEENINVGGSEPLSEADLNGFKKMLDENLLSKPPARR